MSGHRLALLTMMAFSMLTLSVGRPEMAHARTCVHDWTCHAALGCVHLWPRPWRKHTCAAPEGTQSAIAAERHLRALQRTLLHFAVLCCTMRYCTSLPPRMPGARLLGVLQGPLMGLCRRGAVALTGKLRIALPCTARTMSTHACLDGVLQGLDEASAL